jgi:hypothetical protein
MTTHLQQTMDDLVAQRARLDAAIVALQELGAAALPAANGTHAPRAVRRSPAKMPKPAKADGRRRGTTDWARGRQLWDQGKSPKEIAAALGCTTQAVIERAFRVDRVGDRCS